MSVYCCCCTIFRKSLISSIIFSSTSLRLLFVSDYLPPAFLSLLSTGLRDVVAVDVYQWLEMPPKKDDAGYCLEHI